MKALVVDGYNAIYKVPRLRKILDKDLQLARQEITNLAKIYQRKRGGYDKLCVVFDGKDAYRDRLHMSPQHHVYSRTGEGDLEIVRVVRRLSKKYHVEVVSDDNYIRNNSRSHNASIVPVSSFVSSLKKKGKRSEKKKEEHKVSPEVASGINEELKKHWNIT